MPKKITIAGYFGLQNAGDEAILSAMLKDLTQFQHNLEFTVLSYAPGFIASEYSLSTVFWSDWPKVADEIAMSDLVLLSGGLLHDYDGVDLSKILISQEMGFESVVSIPILANQIGIPYMLYAIGVGPLHSDLSKMIVRDIVDRASICTVRDRGSKRLLQKIGSSPDHVQVTADPAFGIDPISTPQVKSILVTEFGSDLVHPLLGVALRSWNFRIPEEEWLQEIIAGCDQYLDHTDGTILFIPFHNHEILQSSDRSISLLVKERMRNRDRAFVLASNYRPREICGVIGNCDYVLGMRLHSLIFASKMCVPFVGLSYDPKVTNFIEEIGFDSHSFDIRRIKGEQLANRLLDLHEERRSICQVLERSKEKFISASRENANVVLDWIESNVVDKVQDGKVSKANSLDQIRRRAVAKIFSGSGITKEHLNSNRQPLHDPNKPDHEQTVIESLIQEPYFTELVGILEENADSKGVIIYPPTIDWGFMFQRPQQMARSLAKDGYLFFYCTGNVTVDNIVGFEQISNRLYLCNVPLPTFNLISRPFLYLGTARHLNMVESFNDPMVIYDFCDDLQVSSVSQEDHKEIVESADLVMATSRKLYKDIAKLKSDALFIPNAADFEYIQSFKKKAKKQVPPPWAPILKSNRGVIGYSGALANWVDYSLISRVACERPDFDVVLIGVDYDGSLKKSGVLRHPNVHWFGMMDYDDLIRSLWYFNVAIIPFLLDEITKSTSPVKLYEYLACGKPVISTNLPECRGRPGVFIGETHDKFIAQIDVAFDSRRKKKLNSEIVKDAKKNTWDKRVNEILPTLRELNKEEGVYVSIPGISRYKVRGSGDLIKQSLNRIEISERMKAELSAQVGKAFNRIYTLETEVDEQKHAYSRLKGDLTKVRDDYEKLNQEYEEMELREHKLARHLESAQAITANREGELKEMQVLLNSQKSELAQLKQNYLVLGQNHDALHDELEKIRASKGWRILNIAWKVVWSLRDRMSCMRSVLFNWKPISRLNRFFQDTFLKRTRNIVRSFLPLWTRAVIFFLSFGLDENEDNSTVVLYTDRDDIFPGYEPRKSLEQNPKNRVKISLVGTVKDEASGVEAWLRALENQSRSPDEVVIVDGGSSDGTVGILENYIEECPIDIILRVEDGVNIAKGRNIAIEQAKHEIIVVADFGSDLSVDYLANIVRPFELASETQVVAGWFETLSKSYFGKAGKYELAPGLQDINPQTFLPSARSIAFRKSAWRKVGGYPEWLTLTGDDTYFALELKRKCPHWAIVPEAVVDWHAPETLRVFWRKLVSWSRGDGESGVYSKRYFQIAITTILTAISAFLVCGLLLAVFSHVTLPVSILIMSVLLAGWYVLSLVLTSRFGKRTGSFLAYLGQLARAVGFIQGVKRRPQVALRRYAEVEGVVFILTGIPIDDTGGGSRGAQIARQFLGCNYLVVYLYKFPKAEHKDLKLPIWHPRLLHGIVSNMDWKAFIWQYGKLLNQKQLLALVEFPLKDFLPYIVSIKDCGGKVIYDLIDDWTSSLGGAWYSEDVENQIYHQADVLIATTQELVRDLHMRSKREVHLLPNAVNLNLFNRRKEYERPRDLPLGKLQIIYTGALWGEWFDWGLLERLAERFPQAAITVIGDYDGGARIQSENVHFLGLKGQNELPSYLAHSDVAIIPWKNNSITQATSPLKVYEYLAMGLPVVAPNIAPLADMPCVFRTTSQDEFLDAVQHAADIEIDLDELDTFVTKNSWSTRVKWLIEHAD